MVLAELLESEVPRHIVMGEDASKELARILRKIQNDDENNNTIHMFFGTKTSILFENKIKSLVEEIKPRLETYIIKDSLVPSLEDFHDDIKQNFASRDLLIAVGGGRIIDSVKYLVALQLRKMGMRVEYINLPTLTSHDGIISPYIFLYPDENSGEKYYGDVHPPLAVIVDLNYLYQHEDLPRHLAASVGDTLAKLTAAWDWKFANRIKGEPFSDFASGTISHAYDLLKSQILIPTEKSYQNLISTAVKALLISGVVTCTANNIRTGFGSEHLFALALDDLIPRKLLHGERCAIGTVIMAYLQDQPWKSYKRILEEVGLRLSINQLEIDPELIVEALRQAHLQNPRMYTILGEDGISRKAARNLLGEIGILE